MTIESLARTIASAKLRERGRIATIIGTHADVLRGRGEHATALAFDEIVTALTGGALAVERSSSEGGEPRERVAPSSPFGMAVIDGSTPLADDDDGSGLPRVQFNSDEEDAFRVLRAQSPMMSRQSALRD